MKNKSVAIDLAWGSIDPNIISQYMIQTQTEVDGTMWYTIIVSKEVMQWLQTQDTKFWYLHKTMFESKNYHVVNMFDVHEELFLIMKLRF